MIILLFIVYIRDFSLLATQHLERKMNFSANQKNIMADWDWKKRNNIMAKDSFLKIILGNQFSNS